MESFVFGFIIALILSAILWKLIERNQSALSGANAKQTAEVSAARTSGISSLEIIHMLIEAIPRPVLLAKFDRTIVDVNPAALYFIGATYEKVIGKLLIKAVNDYETTQLMIAAAQTGVMQERTITRSAQDEVWHVTIKPLFLEPRSSSEATLPSHLLLFIEDETQLRYLETVRKDFVTSVSHELRTPLASTKLLAETLADTVHEDPAAAAEFAGRIVVEVDHLTELVNDLLELSRIESGRIHLELEPTDINGVLEVAAERMRPLAKERNITITAQLNEQLPFAQADAARIEQTLVNLIHNAIKFTPEEGEITLSASLGTLSEGKLSLLTRDPSAIKFIRFDEPCITVKVSDTGVGIPEDDIPRIFERFFKARELPTRDAGKFAKIFTEEQRKGTGLGLAIARHIVESHHGQIWVKSRLGSGSEFYFTLPLAKKSDT